MTRYAGGIVPPVVDWEFEDPDGTVLEDLIVEHLQEFYSDRYDTVTVERTSRSGDLGRDIVIMARETITVFETVVPERAGRPTKIHVECKHRSAERLQADFHDFAQFPDTGPPDYYFLVTTASLTPNMHYKAAQTCASLNVTFRLIDRVLLAEYVTAHNIPIGLRAPIVLPRDIVVEYQVVPSFYAKEHRLDVYLVIWNYAFEARSFHVYLSTNDTWRIVEGPSNVDRIAEARSALQFQLVAKHLTPEEADTSLRLGVLVEGQRREIHVTAPRVEFAFVPQLVGMQHWDEMVHLRDIIDKNIQTAIFSITGRAGVGKSRIVGDALEPRLGKTNIDFAQIFFDATGGQEELFAAMRFLRIRIPAGRKSLDALVTYLLMNAARRGRRRVILFEDLHHAAKPVLDAIKQFTLNTPRLPYPVTVVLTGRNDHTYPNDDYYSLLEVLALAARRNPVLQVELLPLTTRDTRTLIDSIVVEGPKIVRDRIAALSENVPFHVIQAVEYLLEMGIAQLRHRNHVGIPKLSNFAAKQYIPDKIDTLYALRLKALLALPHGQAMFDFLITQSFFGFVVSTVVMDEALDPDAAEVVLRTLIARRFLVIHASDGRITFTHENLLTMLRARARDLEHRERAGKLVLERPTLLALLDDLERGEVLFLAGAFVDALAAFDRLITDVDHIDNFSSEDLDVRFFRFIDAAFESALHCARPPDLLRKMLLAKSYMGIHNYPLKIGVDACDAALEQLRRIRLPNDTRSVVMLEIRQLQAHGLLNMGETVKASGIMLELDQFLRAATLPPPPELAFDIYDRLQELYKKWNHEALARSYGQMARKVATTSRNRKLLACHAITEAGMDLYRDTSFAKKQAQWSYKECKAYGAFRLKIYTRLSTYVAEALLDPTPRTWARVLKKAKLLLREAAVKNLSDSLMRVQLLVATLTYLTQSDDLRAIEAAQGYVRDGLDGCATFGKPLYSWLFYNLAGVLSDAAHGEKDVVRKFFDTAIHELDQQGLLFVGRKDCTYPTVFVISNAVRFRSFFDRVDALKILGRVTDYESSRTDEIQEDRLRRISKSRLFFRPPRRIACLTDPKNGYWLPLL